MPAAQVAQDCPSSPPPASRPPVPPQLLDGMQRASKPVNLHEAFSLPVAFKVGRV